MRFSVRIDKFRSFDCAFCNICHQKLYTFVTFCIILLRWMQPGLWNPNTVIRNRFSPPLGLFFWLRNGSFPPHGKNRLQKTEESPRIRLFWTVGGVADFYNFASDFAHSFFIFSD